MCLLATLWFHRVGHPPNVISTESHLACRSNLAHADPLSFAIRDSDAEYGYKGKEKEEEERGLTCEPEMPRSGGTCFWPVATGTLMWEVRRGSGHLVYVYQCFCWCCYLKSLIRPMFFFQAAVTIKGVKSERCLKLCWIQPGNFSHCCHNENTHHKTHYIQVK